MKQPYTPLPQPKQVVSPQQRQALRNVSEAKKQLGIRGKVRPGDLLDTLSDKKRTAIMGAI